MKYVAETLHAISSFSSSNSMLAFHFFLFHLHDATTTPFLPLLPSLTNYERNRHDIRNKRNLNQKHPWTRFTNVRIHYDTVYTAVATCPSNQFKCLSSGRPVSGSGGTSSTKVQCIPQWQKCDSIDDCIDGSDEVDCGIHRLLLSIILLTTTIVLAFSFLTHYS
jgi:hypothetical protein